MGAIFFYVFIYFIGYYGSSVFNLLTVRPLITNRFLAALVPVVAVAIVHAYMIVSKPPPSSLQVTVESAIFSYVVMPVIIVTLGAIYFMWNTRQKEEEAKEEASDIEENTDNSIAEEIESDDKPSLEASDKENTEQSEENSRNNTP